MLFQPVSLEYSAMANTLTRLPESFFTRQDTLQVARDLLGKLLVVPASDGTRVSGMIVETEAYLGVEDKAAHSYGGRRTARNEITYSEGGHVYVFFVYGMYYQLNLVTGPAEHAHVVLIRGLEPIEGIEIMRERRGVAMPDKNLTSGPGKLTIAMGIDRSYNGEHLLGDRIWVEEFRKFRSNQIESGLRVGIDYAEEFVEMPWRFWVIGNQFVSKVNRSRSV
jgi:DNA-3-methyladenine glycosylase